MDKQSGKSFLGAKTRSGKAIRGLALVSAMLWVAALGVVYAVKEKTDLAEAGHAPAVSAAADGEAHGSELAAVTGEEEKHGEHAAAAAPAHGTAAPAPEAGTPVPEAGTPSREELEAWQRLTELYHANGDLQKAAGYMEKMLRAPIRDAELLTLGTEIFLGTGQYRLALHTVEAALAITPGKPSLQTAAVMAQYRLGEVDKAFREARAALKAHPQDLDLLTALGTMEVEMGPGREGYGRSLEEALKIKPNHVPALYQLGRKGQLEGNYRDAELAFRKVLKYDRHHAKAHGQLGMALYHLRKDKEALKEFQTALAMNPRDYNTWFNLGELRLEQAARDKSPARIREYRGQAMEAYLQAIALNSAHAQAHYRVGVLLNGNGQYKEAVRHLELSLKVDARHVPTLVQLSLAYEKLKIPDRAKACLSKALELDPLNKAVSFKLKQFS